MTMHAAADDRLREARQRLIARGLVAQQPSVDVRPAIERSWRRSISLGAAPSPAGARFVDAIDPDSVLLRAASAVLDHWQRSLSGMGVALFVSDRTGQIIARRVTEPADQGRLDDALAAEGFDFSEHALGTNGLGTPIEDRRPTFVLGSEHFNDSLASLACAGAPVFHPMTRRVVGSIAFAARAGSASPLMLAMAQQAAREVQDQLADSSHSRGVAASAAYLRRRSASAPVVVLSQDSILANLRGLPYVSGEAHAVLWERLCRLDWSEGSAVIDLPDSARQALAHRLDASDGGAVFALEVRPAIRRARQRELDRTGAVELVEPAALDRAAAAAGAVCLVGPGGAGKRHAASAWLTSRTGTAPLALDAAVDLMASGWFERAEAALARGTGVVVAHLEDLPSAARNPLKALAARAASGGAALAITFDDEGAHPQVQALAAQLAPLVRVPPLADAGTRLAALVRALVERHPEADRIALDAPAMQALLRWKWPGNVAELRTLVDTLTAAHPGGIVELRHLPEHLRRRTERTLSPIEALERDAIVAALRDARGNRSVAARTLGIGRTTLYRRLRAFELDDDATMATD